MTGTGGAISERRVTTIYVKDGSNRLPWAPTGSGFCALCLLRTAPPVAESRPDLLGLDVCGGQERGLVNRLVRQSCAALHFSDSFGRRSFEEAVAPLAFRDVGGADVADLLALAGQFRCLSVWRPLRLPEAGQAESPAGAFQPCIRARRTFSSRGLRLDASRPVVVHQHEVRRLAIGVLPRGPNRSVVASASRRR